LKFALCRAVQLALVVVYAVGVLIVTVGVFGFAAKVASRLLGIAASRWSEIDASRLLEIQGGDLESSLALVGGGAIVTYLARGVEKALVSLVKPPDDRFVEILGRPITHTLRKEA